jgi:hypothetical protein
MPQQQKPMQSSWDKSFDDLAARLADAAPRGNRALLTEADLQGIVERSIAATALRTSTHASLRPRHLVSMAASALVAIGAAASLVAGGLIGSGPTILQIAGTGNPVTVLSGLHLDAGRSGDLEPSAFVSGHLHLNPLRSVRSVQLTWPMGTEATVASVARVMGQTHGRLTRTPCGEEYTSSAGTIHVCPENGLMNWAYVSVRDERHQHLGASLFSAGILRATRTLRALGEGEFLGRPFQSSLDTIRIPLTVGGIETNLSWSFVFSGATIAAAAGPLVVKSHQGVPFETSAALSLGVFRSWLNCHGSLNPAKVLLRRAEGSYRILHTSSSNAIATPGWTYEGALLIRNSDRPFSAFVMAASALNLPSLEMRACGRAS